MSSYEGLSQICIRLACATVMMDLVVFSAGLLESRGTGTNAAKTTFCFGEQNPDSQHVCYAAV